MAGIALVAIVLLESAPAAPRSEVAVRAAIARCKEPADWGTPRAYERCSQAVGLARGLGGRLEAEALNLRCWLGSNMNRFDEAIGDGERALSLLADRKDDPLYRSTLLSLASLHRESGAARPAMRFADEALGRARAAGDRLMEAQARVFRARILFWMGDYQAARAEIAGALATARETGNRDLENMAFWQLGMTEMAEERYVESIEAHERALRAATNENNALLMRLNIVHGRIQAGQLALAERDLDSLGAAMARFGAPTFRAVYDAARGYLGFAKKDYRTAAQAFAAAASGSTTAWVKVGALLGRARSLRRQGELEAARVAYEDTIRFVEGTRSRAAAQEQRTSFLAANGAAYRELVALLWEISGEAAAERAFQISEAARARALLDALRGSGVDARDAVEPRPSPEIRGALAPAEVLIEYIHSDDRLFAFSVSADGIRWKRLDLPEVKHTLERRVRFFRALVRETSDLGALAVAGRRIYEDVLAPLLPEDGVTALVIAADGPLHFLPFDALVLPGASGRRPRFLAERYRVRLTPSGSLLAASRPTAIGAHPLLAVADPTAMSADPAVPARFRGRFGPLPASAREAASAARALGPGARALTGAEATEANVKRAGLGRYRIIHFATHGFVDEVLPLRSALVLGPGEGEDGMLQAAELYGLAVPADLVVLSGCHTAFGQVAGSEGVLSLARAFLYAGAGSVVATLWEIEDAESAWLMSHFYARLRGAGDPSAALAATKQELIAAGAPPRAWAAFTLTGRLATIALPPSATRGEGSLRWALPAVIGVAAAVAAWIAARGRLPRARA
jgi:CHAT domain-containing protein